MQRRLLKADFRPCVRRVPSGLRKFQPSANEDNAAKYVCIGGFGIALIIVYVGHAIAQLVQKTLKTLHCHSHAGNRTRALAVKTSDPSH